MGERIASLLAVTPREILSAPGALELTVGLVALLALGLGAGIGIARSRRRFRRDVRAVVQVVEDLRSRRGRGQAEIVPSSPLALVADAVHRLGVDLQHAWREAETAAERWRAVSDVTQDTAIITTDTDGDVRSFSAGASRLTGWDESEVLSRPAAVLFEENAYKDLLPKLARRSLRTQGVTTRSTMARRDGSTFQSEVAVRLLMGSADVPVGFMMLVRDITEQMRLETELRDSERRYRGLIETLAEGVVLVAAGRIAYANPASEALCGRAPGELAGCAWRDCIATRDLLVMQSALESVTAGSSTALELDCTLLGPDGAPRVEARVKATAVEFAGGPAAMLLLTDRTAERRMIAELRQNESRLDAVLEATADGILVIAEDPWRTVRMANQAFARPLGLGVEELLGASEVRLMELLRGATEGGAELARCITAADTDAILALRAPPGRELRVQVAALRGRDGERLGRLVVCRDVTVERRSLRELQEQADQLQLSKAELERSYRQLDEVNGKLESRGQELDRLNGELTRLDKMKSDLIGNVSHELQTPLVSIRGYTEMILKERLGPISEEQRKGLSLSLKNIDRLISMIDNLLAFSRTDPDRQELKFRRFELRPLVDETLALLQGEIAAKALHVTVRGAAEPIVVRADRDQILQVFLNLLSNAVKFGHAGGNVEIALCREQAGHATVVVKDDGAGIPPASLGRIFDRHYQVRRPAGQARGGSGIGLAIVRDILRLHGCTIEVDSEEGRGTEFTFTLPGGADGGEVQPDEPGPPRAQGAARPPSAANQAGSVEARGSGRSASERTRDTPPDPAPERPRLRIIRRYKTEG